MDQALRDNPNVKTCCKQAENRIPHTEVGMGADVVCEKCRVCGRRHFTMTVDPVHMKGLMA